MTHVLAHLAATALTGVLCYVAGKRAGEKSWRKEEQSLRWEIINLQAELRRAKSDRDDAVRNAEDSGYAAGRAAGYKAAVDSLRIEVAKLDDYHAQVLEPAADFQIT
jgi:50S ribosomal subunit-associated GTPase HflX